MAEPLRVLVVDDSSFFRKRIRSWLEQGSGITVVGEAVDGEQAVQLAAQMRPDLITMDVAMPKMDGIEAVRRIMRQRRIPIVMFSALTRDGARATLDALDAGAVDFITKQSEPDQAGQTDQLLRQRILEIVRDFRHSGGQVRHAEAKIARSGGQAAIVARTSVSPPVPVARSVRSTGIELVVIGASTGGPVAISQILAALPANYPHPILVAVHMPAAFTATYAERLDAQSRLTVKLAESGMALQAGQALLAPGGQQTLLRRSGSRLLVQIEPPGEQIYKPCIDLTFSSAAGALGKGVLGVVLTGMGSDGSQGAAHIKQTGGMVWSQDQASCVVYGMPMAVARAGLTDRVLPLNKIAAALQEQT